MGGRIKLGIHLSQDLKLVKADEGQLEQVIMNLALNARDAISDDGRLDIATHAIAPSDAHPRGGVELVISDTGHGMSPETQRRVFEPFFTTKSLGKGTGLGLATVYGIVKQCGGKIELTSKVGIGTKFTIHLPAAQEQPEPSTASGNVSPRLGRRILLVEDDTALRDATARLLQNQGYDVLVARSPAHAKQLCDSGECPVDLVLSDVMMPEMSGPALAKELVAAHPTLRVLFMSAYVGQSTIADDLLNSGVPIVEKPFEPSELSDKLEQVFR
jgi:CheY-like chemotaxis protein